MRLAASTLLPLVLLAAPSARAQDAPRPAAASRSAAGQRAASGPEAAAATPGAAAVAQMRSKLRLLTARIALLQHDEASYRADLQTAEQWLRNYFDLRERATQAALINIQQLSSSNIVIELPDISESLGLVNRYKLTLDHGNESQER